MVELLERSLDGDGVSVGEDAAWALLNARTVVQLAESQYDNLTSRDQSMAENVLRLLRDPDARILLWAHNVHVIESVPIGSSRPGMGVILDHALGEPYRSIAITFSFGESRSFDPTSNSLVTHELPVIPGTVGAELRRLGSPAFFLDVRALRGESSFAWLSRQQSFRWAGWAAHSTILSLVPTDAFDGLAFIEVISPARAIDRD